MILEELGKRKNTDSLFLQSHKLSLLELLEPEGEEDVDDVVGSEDDISLPPPPAFSQLDPTMVAGEFAEPFPEEFAADVDPTVGETIPVDPGRVDSMGAGVAAELSAEASNPSGGDSSKAGVLGQLVGILDSIKSKFGGTGNATVEDVESLSAVASDPAFQSVSAQVQDDVLAVLNSAHIQPGAQVAADPFATQTQQFATQTSDFDWGVT